MMNDPPLYYYGPSGSPTRADALASFHEEIYEASIAVYIYSSKPYNEFFASMVEMLVARLALDLTVDWDYMEELLLCYLELNEKKMHKYIRRAFVDVMGVLSAEFQEC
ncbi:hypothetical protein BUALT_Bualt10G0110200 [Buddleja alternifolia]|uniref:Transcription repressor n=1 Tax=Buddleja alternifolia TaxID=168488 RepID=A0AAV6WXW0_9LAMI|nr:hypothetical protein BUALT_Bualt10G0110200 [Buddleja alternifolia]